MRMKYMSPAIFIFTLFLHGILAQTIYMGTIQTGDEDYGYWNNVVFTPDGSRGLVTDPENSRVIVFDPRLYFDNILSSVTTGAEPAGIYLTPGGEYACVLNINSDTVTVIRLSDYQRVTYNPPVNTDFAMWNNIAFSPSGLYGFICDANIQVNRVHVFRVTTSTSNLHHATLNVGVGPARVYVSPLGDRAFVLCTGKDNNDEISVVNLTNEPGFSVQQTFVMTFSDFDRYVDYRFHYNNIVFAPDGSFGYVCDPRWNDVMAFGIPNYSNQPYLELFDWGEGHGETDSSMCRLAISPDGATLLASSILRNRVYIINRETLTVQYVIEDQFVNFDGFNSIVCAPDGVRAFIGSVGSDELLEMNVLFGYIIEYHPTGAGPETLAISPDGRFLSSINVFGNSVDIFSLYPKVINIPFFRTGIDEYTGYGISNPSSEPFSIITTAIDGEGGLMNGTVNPAVTILEDHTQFPFIGDQHFGLPAGEYSGWIQAISNSSEAKSFFLNTNVSGDYMDGTVASDRMFMNFYLTHVRENLNQGVSTVQTELYLVNPYSFPVDLTLVLKDETGTEISSFEITLENGEMLTGTLREIFLRDETYFDITRAYIVGTVTNNSLGVAGFARMLVLDPDKSGSIQTIHSLPIISDEQVSTLYCPHLANGGEEEHFTVPYDTVFHVINTADENSCITFTMYDDNSEDTYSTDIDLAPRHQFSGHGWEVFGLEDPSEHPEYVTGNVVITSDRPGIIGDVIFGDGLNESPLFESSLTLYQHSFNRAVFSHVAHGPAGTGDIVYFNGISVSNPNDYDINVWVRIYQENGNLTGSNTIHLTPNSRLLRLLDAPELVPDSWGQLGGYVVLECNHPFVAFELFIDNQDRFISAVPRN